MLKVLGRIAIILLATFLVVGATYAIAQNVNLALPVRGDFDDRIGPGGGGPLAERPEGLGGGLGESPGEHDDGSVFGWIEVVKSLVVIMLVTAGVVIVQKAYERQRRSRVRPAGINAG